MKKFIITFLSFVCIIGIISCGSSKKTKLSNKSEIENENYSENGHSSYDSDEGSSETASENKAEFPIKINEVDVEQLMAYKISGIGPAIAQAIIDYRDENGPFKSMADIDKVPRVGPALLAKLEGKLDFGEAGATASEAAPVAETPAAGESQTSASSSTQEPQEVSTAAAPAKTTSTASKSSSSGKINVNTATAEQLQELNGIGPSTADAIVKYRQEHGKFKTIEDLDNVPRIGPATIEKFRNQVAL